MKRVQVVEEAPILEALHTKYRPTEFEDVVGQDSVVRSLKGVLEKGSSQAFLFTGPSGTGKTTLARIVASKMGCALQDLIEIDAATYTGIDAMREVTAGLVYKPLGAGSIKAIVIDECHALSKQAFQSLLKILEEPPSYVVWLLCTTEPMKVPKAIVTRCVRYDLKPVDPATLAELLVGVVEEEKLDLGKTADDIIDLCASEAEGSPRQALVNLTLCAAAESYADAQKLLRSGVSSAEAVELARALVKGTSWKEVQRLLEGLKDVNPESVRHVVRAYVTKVVLGAKSEAQVSQGLAILDAFAVPFNSSDGVTPIVLACGRLLVAEVV